MCVMLGGTLTNWMLFDATFWRTEVVILPLNTFMIIKIINAVCFGSSSFSFSFLTYGMITSSNSFKHSCSLLECIPLALSVREFGNLTCGKLFEVLHHKSAAWVNSTTHCNRKYCGYHSFIIRADKRNNIRVYLSLGMRWVWKRLSRPLVKFNIKECGTSFSFNFLMKEN